MPYDERRKAVAKISLFQEMISLDVEYLESLKDSA